jgi:hypothetical protein
MLNKLLWHRSQMREGMKCTFFVMTLTCRHMLVDLMLTRSLLVEVAAHSTAHIYTHKKKLRIHQHQKHVSTAALTWSSRTGAGASGGCREGQASGPGPPRAVPGPRPSNCSLVWHRFSRLPVWKAGVPLGVPAASRPSRACLIPSWPKTATVAAAVWSPEWTAHLERW